MSGPDSLKVAGSWELGTQEELCCGVFPKSTGMFTAFCPNCGQMRDRWGSMWILATVWFSELGYRFFKGGNRCGEESQGPRAEVLKRKQEAGYGGGFKEQRHRKDKGISHEWTTRWVMSCP